MRLDERCKKYEAMEASRAAMPGLPLLARLDGRAFHTFTRGLRRPWDERLSRCFRDTAVFLMERFRPIIAYTQSDEITLLWHDESEKPREFLFGGRFQKLASVLPSAASALFNRLIDTDIPERVGSIAHFDARVWQVPSKRDAVDVLIWREDDATRNSVSMAASEHYSVKELHGKNTSEMHEMLWRCGINWNDYPAHFKRGTYLRTTKVERILTNEEWYRIPEAHRPPRDQAFTRHRVVDLDMPPIRRVANLFEVVFDGATPRQKSDSEPHPHRGCPCLRS